MKVAAMMMSGGLAWLMALPSPARGEPAKTAEAKPICNKAAGMVSFRKSSSKVDKAGRHTLDEVAGWLREDDQRKAEVEAYADQGAETKNADKLSDKRAKAVETYLRGKGIDAERVQVYGRGDAVPAGLAAATDHSRMAVVSTCEPAPPAPEPAPAAAAATPEGAPPVMAQNEPAPAEMPAPPPVAAPVPVPAEENVGMHAAEPHPKSGIGVAVTVGGGVTGFWSSGSRASADAGPSWDARLTLGTRTIIGLDMAYLGAAQKLKINGLSSDAGLLSNGAEADLRLQLPTGIARPYIFGGIGWTHYSLHNSSTGTTGILGGDDVGTVPMGVGLAIGKPNSIAFDIRATARVAFDDQLLDGVSGASASSSLSSWGVIARIGGEF
jgi:hypothetical protein